jgi:hypothetical protein
MYVHCSLLYIPESIVRFIEDQAFSPTYDLASLLLPSLHSNVSKLDSHTGRLRKRDNLLTETGEGVGEEPNHTIARKTGPL